LAEAKPIHKGETFLQTNQNNNILCSVNKDLSAVNISMQDFLFIIKYMSMSSWRFKTNINCNNCIRTVTNFLNSVEGVESWTVDTTVPDKFLTVVGTATPAQVMAAVEEAGFDIELLED
jgi:copper chaperone